jgi:hypothetical protein
MANPARQVAVAALSSVGLPLGPGSVVDSLAIRRAALTTEAMGVF